MIAIRDWDDEQDILISVGELEALEQMPGWDVLIQLFEEEQRAGVLRKVLSGEKAAYTRGFAEGVQRVLKAVEQLKEKARIIVRERAQRGGA